MNRPPAGARLPYLPALDGLRGIAVMAVLLFHGTTSAPGGYLGVDLFFVLSGFLITTLLLREHGGTGRIDLLAFWGRRARRLLPALLIVVLTVVVVTSTGLAGTGLAPVRVDAVATLTYWVNWRFVAEGSDYFTAFQAPSPLRHMWSLAIEEQWYLLWPPLVMVVLSRANRRALTVLVLSLGAASATVMVVLRHDVNRAYFGTDARVQTLLAGALLALVVDRRPLGVGRHARRAAALGAAAALPVLIMLWKADGRDAWMYQGGFTLFAGLGAVVVGSATLPFGPVARGLAARPLVAIGRISYGLYLWHWPIDIWLSPQRAHLSGMALFAVRTAVALVLSAVSLHLVELPARRARPVRQWSVPVVGAGAAMAVLASAMLLPQPVPAAVFGAGESFVLPAYVPPDQPRTITPALLDATPAPSSDSHPLRVTVVGDSVGWSLSWYVGALDRGAVVLPASLVGCTARGEDYIRDGRPTPLPALAGFDCDDSQDFWRTKVAYNDPDVTVLVLGAWEVLDRQDPELGRLRVGTPEWRSWALDGLESTVTQLAAGAPDALIAVAEVPCYEAVELELGGTAAERNDPERVAAVNDLIHELVDRHPDRVSILPLMDWVCDDGRAITERDGVQLRSDGIHFTHEGAILTWNRWWLPKLRALVTEHSVP